MISYCSGNSNSSTFMVFVTGRCWHPYINTSFGVSWLPRGKITHDAVGQISLAKGCFQRVTRLKTFSSAAHTLTSWGKQVPQSKAGFLSNCICYLLLLNKPPSCFSGLKQWQVVCLQICNLGKVQWKQLFSVLLNINSKSLKARDWDHPKTSSFTCVVVFFWLSGKIWTWAVSLSVAGLPHNMVAVLPFLHSIFHSRKNLAQI